MVASRRPRLGGSLLSNCTTQRVRRKSLRTRYTECRMPVALVNQRAHFLASSRGVCSSYLIGYFIGQSSVRVSSMPSARAKRGEIAIRCVPHPSYHTSGPCSSCSAIASAAVLGSRIGQAYGSSVLSNTRSTSPMPQSSDSGKGLCSLHQAQSTGPCF